MNTILEGRVILLRAFRKFTKDFKYLSDVINLDDLRQQIVSDNVRLLSLSTDEFGKVSYAAKPKHRFDSNKRVKTSLGKFITSNYKSNLSLISDATLNNIVIDIWKFVAQDPELKYDFYPIFSFGKDITKIYAGRPTTLNENGKTKNESCMTGDGNAFKLRLYEENPNRVKLVSWANLRALVWNTDNGNIVLDRIYPTGDYKAPAFVRLMYRFNHINCHRESCTMHVSDGTIQLINRHGDNQPEEKVTLKRPDYKKYPYIDTFRYGKFSGNTVIISNDHEFGRAVFDCEDGSFDAKEGYVVCCECEDIVEVCDSTTNDDDKYCDDCFGQKFSRCDDCHDTVDNDDIVYIDSEDLHVCSTCAENYTECHNCYEHFAKTIAIEAHDTDNCYCPECAEDCIKECYFCEHAVEHFDEITIYDNDGDSECCIVCNNCKEAKITKCCGKCNQYYKNRDLDLDDMCEECSKEMELAS